MADDKTAAARPATLDMLRPKLREFEVSTPDDDGIVLFSMRDVTDAMLDAARTAAGDRPKAPHDPQKNKDGTIVKVYDYNDPGYRARLGEYLQLLDELVAIQSWSMDIPGATLQEKHAYLTTETASWVRVALVNIVGQMTRIDGDAIRERARTFQRVRPADPGNAPSVGVESGAV